MKLLFFNEFRLGVLIGDAVVDVTDIVGDLPRLGPQDVMRGLIESFDRFAPAIAGAVKEGARVPLATVRIRPPLPRPSTIVCMAVNYMEDRTKTERPAINAFLKPGSTVIGDGDTMVLPDVPASVFEGEAELGVVIGKRAVRVSAVDAMSCVFGYVNFIDGSARGLPPTGNTFYQMKARDTFTTVGPFLVTADEVPHPQRLPVRQWSNGRIKQEFNTSDMAHAISRCIEWVTSVHALEPGDILATGTNHRGLFSYQHDDSIEMEIEPLGRLHLRVRDDLKRTWGRETRLERTEKGLEAISPQLTGKYAVIDRTPESLAVRRASGTEAP